jgi:hypothetical protein
VHPRIREILDHLAAWRVELAEAFESVPADLRDQRPAATSWSVAEIVEHLAIVETAITRVVSQGVRTATPGPDVDSTPVLPTLDQGRLLDRSEKRVAPDALLPSGTMTAAEAWDALGRSRDELLEAITEFDGLALDVIRAPHPSLGELNGYQWLGFIGAHEARHARQVREVGGLLAPDPEP